MHFIKEQGIDRFIEEQNKRIELLEEMIAKFDDGRSRSFFCSAVLSNDLAALEKSIEKADAIVKTDKIKKVDLKGKAKILKAIINEISSAE